MGTDESRRGKDPASLSGGHLCHVCGYQYPNPHPSAKQRRSHRKHCAKGAAAVAAGEAVAEVEEAVAGVGVGVGKREEGAGAHNAADGTRLGGGGGGGQREEIGASEANGGGAALPGSAGGVASSVEDKVIAENASPTGTGAHVIATELRENNRLINCSDESPPEDTGTQTITSELSENGLLNRSSNSIENVNEGNGTESQIACTNGSQTKVRHPAEREDSFDEYQDASPFLHQSDSEDGSAPSSVFCTEINNLNTISLGSGAATANEISLETNGLCKDHQVSGEPSVRDLSSDSKIGYNLEDGALRLSEREVNLKLWGPYQHSLNVDTYTDMVNSKSDKTSDHSDMFGDSNASSLQETHPLILEPESESTSSGKVEGFMEDRLDVLHTMSEVSPRPEVIGSDIAQLETITNHSTNAMKIGSDLNVVCSDNAPTDCSTELPTQNWTVADISYDHQPVENYCKKSLEASFQHDLPVTNVDDISITNVNDLEFTFEGRPQPVEENVCIPKTSGFTKEEVRNKQIDPEIPSEDQLSLSQKHAASLTDEVSSVKNPFNLDDDRNDDLFELPTDGCYLEAPNSVELRQRIDSTSLVVDQPTDSGLTRMAEGQQCHNSNERIPSMPSAIENGEVIGPEDMPVSTSELVNKTCLTDHGLKEDGHASGVAFVPSQAASTEFSTVSMQDIDAVSAEFEVTLQAKDASAKEMTTVRSIDGVEIEHATGTTANDAYAANVEEKKLLEDSAAEMNEVQQSDHVDKEKQAGSTEVSSVQNIANLEENKQTEDTDTKEMNAGFNADDVEDKTQTDDTSAENSNEAGGTDDSEEKMLAQDTTEKEMIAAQSTDNFEEKQQRNGIVGQEGNNTQNEEIAAPGTRLNSGRVHVPLKVLLAEASAENQVKKPTTKERVLSFRRRVSKDGNSSGKSLSPKSGSDDHHWSSPAKLPRKDVDKSSKVKKQPWMPFICCHSVH